MKVFSLKRLHHFACARDVNQGCRVEPKYREKVLILLFEASIRNVAIFDDEIVSSQ